MYSPRPRTEDSPVLQAQKAKAAEVLGAKGSSLVDFAYKPVSPVFPRSTPGVNLTVDRHDAIGRPAGDQALAADTTSQIYEVLGSASGSLIDFAYKPVSPVFSRSTPGVNLTVDRHDAIGRPAGDQTPAADPTSHESRGMGIQAFIAQELAVLRTSMLSEVKSCNLECLSAMQVSHSRCLAEVLVLRRMLESGQVHIQDAKMEKGIVQSSNLAEVTIEKGTAQRSNLVEVAVDEKDKELLSKAYRETTEPGIDNVERNMDFIGRRDDDIGLYRPIVDAAVSFKSKSIWQNLLDPFLSLPHAPPNTVLARITESSWFVFFQTCAILSNTAIMGFETDAAIKAAVERPSQPIPEWLDVVFLVYNIFFIVELLYRMIALRVWFLISPDDWAWNMFDTFIVLSSIITDFVLSDVNLSFLRTMRMLRAIRAARVIRVMKFFRQLRKMLFSILGMMSSLVWFLLFLAIMMYMTSILLLQGLANALQEQDDGDFTSGQRMLAKEYYGTFMTSMHTLLAAVTGGRDWRILEEPLKPAGLFYRCAFIAYVIFISLGVVQVLVGMFSESNADFVDDSLIVVQEKTDIERDVHQMLDVFESLDKAGHGKVTWNAFQLAMRDEHIQAYLSYHKVEPAHALMTYQILDHQQTGEVELRDIIMGMLKLKSAAKAIDARVIMHQNFKIGGLLQRKLQGQTWTALEDYMEKRN